MHFYATCTDKLPPNLFLLFLVTALMTDRAARLTCEIPSLKMICKGIKNGLRHCCCCFSVMKKKGFGRKYSMFGIFFSSSNVKCLSVEQEPFDSLSKR